MIIDMVMLAIPIPFWREIAHNKKSKTALVGLFTVGAVVVSISVARLVTLVQHRAGTSPNLDLTFFGPPIFIASVLEVQVAVLAASMPIFWPIIESLSMGTILVVNEVTVQSHGAPSQRSQSGAYSDWEETEFHRLNSKEGPIAGWHDPAGGMERDMKYNPHSSTHCMPIERPIPLRPMNNYSRPRNAGPPPPRRY